MLSVSYRLHQENSDSRDHETKMKYFEPLVYRAQWDFQSLVFEVLSTQTTQKITGLTIRTVRDVGIDLH